MRRDVTTLLTVDSSDDRSMVAPDAVAGIQQGRHVVVADDATAVAVLMQLGRPLSGALNQVRYSYGPFLDPSDPQVQHLSVLAADLAVPTATHIGIPSDWATLNSEEKDRKVGEILTYIGRLMLNRTQEDPDS